ncbi:UNVERIFIED_CONTAM: hypothetical protein GTU68_025521 [Idotea baltica]|nr:hypothetical protein [Idotea baltica]
MRARSKTSMAWSKKSTKRTSASRLRCLSSVARPRSNLSSLRCLSRADLSYIRICESPL